MSARSGGQAKALGERCGDLQAAELRERGHDTVSPAGRPRPGLSSKDIKSLADDCNIKFVIPKGYVV
jgi:hypothetical protein